MTAVRALEGPRKTQGKGYSGREWLRFAERIDFEKISQSFRESRGENIDPVLPPVCNPLHRGRN